MAITIGITEEYFWSIHPALFSAIIDQYSQQQQQEWERTRWLATILLQPHSKKTLQPTDVAAFSWEESDKLDISKKEEILHHYSKLAAAMDADHHAKTIPINGTNRRYKSKDRRRH